MYTCSIEPRDEYYLSYLTFMNTLKTFLIICGVLGIGTLLLNLFSSIGDNPKKRWTSKFPAIGSDEFFTALSRLMNTPVERGDEIQILNNGDEFLPAFYEALTSAKKTINLTTYIWRDGKILDTVFEILIERANAGVEVRILIDGLGGKFVSQHHFEKLKNAGVIVGVFRPPRFGKLTRIHRRNHRRAMVIDGYIGFTGGMAFSDQWLGNAQTPEEWHDMMFKMKGAMAHSLQGAFAELWAGTTGEVLTGEKFYPPIPKSRHDSQYVSVASSPAPDTAPLPNFYWFSISAAKKRILMTYPYIIPDKDTLNAIIQRARAGVSVKIILPSKHTDAQPVRWVSASHYEKLIKAGVEIYEYQPTFLHSKALVIDDKWSMIGSANMDIRSREANVENVMGVLDEEFAKNLEAIFLADKALSKKIILKNWRRNHFFIELLGLVSSMFDKQY
jgi:cardiolipin synthase A/B